MLHIPQPVLRAGTAFALPVIEEEEEEEAREELRDFLCELNDLEATQFFVTLSGVSENFSFRWWLIEVNQFVLCLFSILTSGRLCELSPVTPLLSVALNEALVTAFRKPLISLSEASRGLTLSAMSADISFGLLLEKVTSESSPYLSIFAAPRAGESLFPVLGDSMDLGVLAPTSHWSNMFLSLVLGVLGVALPRIPCKFWGVNCWGVWGQVCGLVELPGPSEGVKL
ncbi:hypothetical protein E2C01_020963 [Portunus trituberculatus]|uniref:Uncharacterized protein n=1 Tax=Portunus trituberculatus TaxID=210409 RepID=A0A5B7E2Z6_PORTR|nr:hypothetical protein [Portunus trituberculatus]